MLLFRSKLAKADWLIFILLRDVNEYSSFSWTWQVFPARGIPFVRFCTVIWRMEWLNVRDTSKTYEHFHDFHESS